MPGTSARTHSLACKNKKHTSVVATGTALDPAFPARVVLTVSSVLSPVTGLSCHRRRPRCESIVTDLTSASGCQDHTASPSAMGAFVCRTICVHRIPRPTSVTIAKRPSYRVRDGVTQ
jgi:hypothetical protein